VWGYQTNYGSYCQFARAQAHQCLPKPERLTWEQAGCFLLCASTAYRMLNGWPPNVVEPGDVVLVWGGAGGLGSMAIGITRALGGRAVAVVSDAGKRQFCLDVGAVGVIDRTSFGHWGRMPSTTDAKAYGEWLKGARALGKAIWDVLGERTNPRIVFEHPGEATLPTSEFVCATGGMVVICAGTTGYNVTMDLRYHWMRQKRFQGSHLSNDVQAAAVLKLVADGHMDPLLSATYRFDDLPECHQMMLENRHPHGNMGVLVNASAPGLGSRTTSVRQGMVV
jgi:crotonyl-CoA carboxylase/reductase